MNIKDPLNSPSFPTFHTYIIFKNQKYGLEFINLSEEILPQGNNRFEQTNRIDLDLNKFLYLIDNNKIHIKIVVTKQFYK